MTKTSYPLKMSSSLTHAAERLAESDGVSLNHWINIAVAQKVGVVETAEKFRARYGEPAPGDMRKVLDTVRANVPDDGDELDARTTTVTGTPFSYRPVTGGYRVTTHANAAFTIPGAQMKRAREVISARPATALGASLDNPPVGSLGHALKATFTTNYATYIVPILRDDGVCTVERDGRGFVIKRVTAP